MVEEDGIEALSECEGTAHHRRRIKEDLANKPGPMGQLRRVTYVEEMRVLEGHLKSLKAGEGIRDTKKQFPYDIPP